MSTATVRHSVRKRTKKGAKHIRKKYGKKTKEKKEKKKEKWLKKELKRDASAGAGFHHHTTADSSVRSLDGRRDLAAGVLDSRAAGVALKELVGVVLGHLDELHLADEDVVDGVEAKAALLDLLGDDLGMNLFTSSWSEHDAASRDMNSIMRLRMRWMRAVCA